MPAPFLPYGHQVIDDDDVAAVSEALRSGWLTTGPNTEAFEKAFAAKVGAAHAVACANGTAALHLALLAMGFGPGDVAIVPTLTFLATANAAIFCGGEVVFADVDPETGLMSAQTLEEAIARAAPQKPKVVLPVHLNGQVADLAAIGAVAAAHGMMVVDDACHAVGAGLIGQDGAITLVGSGAASAMSAFSLHPVKTLTMGEGGVVTTADAALAAQLRLLRSHGMVRAASEFQQPSEAFDPSSGQPNPWYYEMSQVGYNYRASDINCALGLSQLRKLDRFIAARAAVVAAYDQALAPLAPLITPLPRVGWSQPSWHLYVARLDFPAIGLSRAAVMGRLRDQGIGTQVHYLPVHRQPFYRRRCPGLRLPGADRYYERCLSLPLFVGMDETQVARVVDALKALLP